MSDVMMAQRVQSMQTLPDRYRLHFTSGGSYDMPPLLDLPYGAESEYDLIGRRVAFIVDTNTRIISAIWEACEPLR